MTPQRILFVGANPSVDRLYEVDRLDVGSIHRPREVVAVPGGKGLNAARAAAGLRGQVIALGLLAGRSGDWIEEAIGALGIEGRWIRTSGETRTCISILDRASGVMTEFYERGEPIDSSDWKGLERLVGEAISAGDAAAIALSGSLPPGAPVDGFGRIARIARSGQSGFGPVPVLADTYGPALSSVLAERPAIVKVNAAEAGEATGIAVTDPQSAAAAASALVREGAACVVVTLGRDGAVVVTAASAIQLVPPEVRGPYPVGSGDAFLGGLALGLSRAEETVAAARLGLAAGIANALVPGAGNLDPDSIGSIHDAISVVGIG